MNALQGAVLQVESCRTVLGLALTSVEQWCSLAQLRILSAGMKRLPEGLRDLRPLSVHLFARLSILSPHPSPPFPPLPRPIPLPRPRPCMRCSVVLTMGCRQLFLAFSFGFASLLQISQR